MIVPVSRTTKVKNMKSPTPFLFNVFWISTNMLSLFWLLMKVISVRLEQTSCLNLLETCTNRLRPLTILRMVVCLSSTVLGRTTQRKITTTNWGKWSNWKTKMDTCLRKRKESFWTSSWIEGGYLFSDKLVKKTSTKLLQEEAAKVGS